MFHYTSLKRVGTVTYTLFTQLVFGWVLILAASAAVMRLTTCSTHGGKCCYHHVH